MGGLHQERQVGGGLRAEVFKKYTKHPTLPAIRKPGGDLTLLHTCGLKSIPLQKRANDIPLITSEYHSVSFSTIGPFNDISAGLSGTLKGNLKYHSTPLDGTKNPKYHSKTFRYHSNTLGHNTP